MNPIQIIIVSDNHFQSDVLKTIVDTYPNADFYLHCGDSQMHESDLLPFISVKGNNDYYRYPKQRLIKINDFFSLIYTHGDGFGYLNMKHALKKLAMDNHCQIVCYGHTHVPDQTFEDNIYIFNPGSVSFPRSMVGKTYMVLEINNDKLSSSLIKID